MRIAILSHWRTYSSLLARQFRLAGMRVENSAWVAQLCDANTELHALNHVGERYWKGKMPFDEATRTIQNVLVRFKEEAERQNWEHYGFKVTHAVFANTFNMFVDRILEFWGEDTAFLTTMSDPATVCWNTRMYPEWTPERIYDCLAEAAPAVAWIQRRGHLIRTPEDWENGHVEEVAEKLGLHWTEEIGNLYVPEYPPDGYKEELEAKLPAATKERIAVYDEIFEIEDDLRAGNFKAGQPQSVVVEESDDTMDDETI